MEKIHSLSFYENNLKYITLGKNNTNWVLVNHGEISLPQDRPNDKYLHENNSHKEIFKKKRLKKNIGHITVEPHHTYLNRKSLNTLKKLKYPDIIKINYKNTLPVLFEKNCYGLDYNVQYNEKTETTEIFFMGMSQEKIDAIYHSSLNLNIHPLVLNPTYQYFAGFISNVPIFDVEREYLVYVESSAADTRLTLVLIHNHYPILKRSVEINERLDTEMNNYFYYLKYYLQIPTILLCFSIIDQNTELIILNSSQQYYKTCSVKIYDIFTELQWFKEVDKKILFDYQDCFIALGGLVSDESINRKK